ncbi:Transcriptional regulator [Sphingorhabdus sp. 109]|nr:Transcriptional regulator [Sphingorhabdus sp. 109]
MLYNHPYIDIYRNMDSIKAIEALGALAQNTRLDVFRLLVRHEPAGLPAGEIARRLDVPQNTMSSHLATLSRADLVSSKRDSRLIIYRANLAAMNGLVAFLLENCCSGEECAPLTNQLERLCQ